MLKYFLSLFFLVFGLGSGAAQSSINYTVNFPAKTSPNKTFSSDTLKILAVMADFQTDKDEATFGDGTFGSIYSKDYGNTIIDPLPHDKSYFENHLEFVKNYYSQVSKNKLNIIYSVLSNVVTVSKTMRNYTSPRNSDDFSNLADFSQEVWELVSNANPGFDFSSYNVFIIFHAGVGNEVTLPGSLGIEKDLPSIFLSNKTLKNIYGQSFEGFTISNSSFKIPNSMIIPETESRENQNIFGTTLVELTFNGLLAANIGNFIGLPDLFNTKTGESAIGRFGLMDGESFFSFRGLFPPQPSAWEKIKLGWAQAVTVSPGKYNINIIADLAASLTDTVILKVPISSKEYFLVENRNRDVNNDGANITYISGIDTLQKSFSSDINGFNNNAVDSLEGVLINIDEYDWALPGNGILIWHIDENIIDAKIDSNKINADSKRRGIFLEEADGIFDIGEKFITILGDVIIGQGTADDFWFSGNKSEFYENRFAPDTRPSSNSNNGANSLITISNFSVISNSMNFQVSYGDSIIVPKIFSHLSLNSKNNHLSMFSESGIIPSENFFGRELHYILTSGNTLNIINKKGEIDTTINNFSNFKPALLKFNLKQFIIGGIDSTLNIFVWDKNGNKNIYKVIVPNEVISTSPVIIRFDFGNFYQVLVGTNNGKVFMYDLNSLTTSSPFIIGVYKQGNNKEILQIASTFKDIVAIGKTSDGNYGYFFYGSFRRGFYPLDGAKPSQIVLTNDNNGKTIGVVQTQNNFFIFREDSLINNINLSIFGQNISAISLADLKQDGNIYITFTADNKIEAINISGAEADYFPFVDTYNFNSNVLNSNITGNDFPELFAVTQDGRIMAVNGDNGNIINNFPILMGTLNSSALLLHKYEGLPSIAALDSNNNFYVWQVSKINFEPFWSEENGNANNTNYLPAAKTTNIINLFLPKDRSYNYPNPVYGSTTNIRYFVNEDSKINIKIFDISGSLITELNNTAQGGFDNETVWNVSNIQSGIYLARIEAVGKSGKTETNIIKIAVVK